MELHEICLGITAKKKQGYWRTHEGDKKRLVKISAWNDDGNKRRKCSGVGKKNTLRCK